ncbi:MAG: iron chelate uptake ABC transporter family permease subunit [Chlamydiota bacterium]|jgi:manganese/zinc/iron transport system permease protein
MNVLEFFTDPILRAPTIGCLLMGISSSIMGVISMLRKRSLIGEALSHATYPGVVLGVSFFGVFFPSYQDWSFLGVFLGATLSSYLAIKIIHILETKYNVNSDASLCFVLSTFFGIGLLFASHIQFSLTFWYQKIQVYLYGQSATMTDVHVIVYAFLTSLTLLFLIGFYNHLKVILFNLEYAKTIGIKTNLIEGISFFLFVVSIVIGLRSVGIVLMSGMLIAPAVFARQFTERLSTLFLLAILMSLTSAFLGNYFSYVLSEKYLITMPTGPLIVIIGTLFAFFALLFAPKRGFIFRKVRIWNFKRKCVGENILKSIWKSPSQQTDFLYLRKNIGLSTWFLRRHLKKLEKEGWLRKGKNSFALTCDGIKKSERIVRLHRLWEVYLAEHLDVGVEKVHKNAEEMEHIITPELEKKLTKLLDNPTKDPHLQPIPKE